MPSSPVPPTDRDSFFFIDSVRSTVHHQSPEPRVTSPTSEYLLSCAYAGMKRLVKKHQPDISIVEIEDVGEGLSILSKALGQAAAKDIKPLTEAWPFVD